MKCERGVWGEEKVVKEGYSQLAAWGMTDGASRTGCVPIDQDTHHENSFVTLLSCFHSLPHAPRYGGSQREVMSSTGGVGTLLILQTAFYHYNAAGTRIWKVYANKHVARTGKSLADDADFASSRVAVQTTDCAFFFLHARLRPRPPQMLGSSIWWGVRIWCYGVSCLTKFRSNEAVLYKMEQISKISRLSHA